MRGEQSLSVQRFCSFVIGIIIGLTAPATKILLEHDHFIHFIKYSIELVI